MAFCLYSIMENVLNARNRGDNGKLSAYFYPPGTINGCQGFRRDIWVNEYIIDRSIEGWEDKMKYIIKFQK